MLEKRIIPVISFHKEFPKDFIVGVRIPTGANRGEVVAHVSGGQVRQGHMDQIKAEVGGVKGVHSGLFVGRGRGLVWEGGVVPREGGEEGGGRGCSPAVRCCLGDARALV